MSKIFAVLVEPAPGYDDYVRTHPEHNQRQRAWLVTAANEGKLLACGPYAPQDGTGLWLLRAASREEAEAIVRSSPRHQDGQLSLDRTRVVEWAVSIGKERFSRPPE